MKKKRTAFVPRLVVSGLAGVVPACIVGGAFAGCTDNDNIVALAIAAFDAAADAIDAAADASNDGTPIIVALAVAGFDSGADSGTPSDASDLTDANDDGG